MATAIEQAEAVAAALGEAEGLAWQAMLDGRIRYSHQRGWGERILLEKRIFYRLCMSDPKIGAEQRAAARKILLNAIKAWRIHNIAETRGIDTSVPGWRGGRAA